MMNKRYLTKILTALSVTFAALIFLVIILSWIVAALSSDTMVRSLLSSEGVRWLFASFTDNIAGPILVWLVLVAMAYGAAHNSALINDLIGAQRGQKLSYRQKYAYRIVALLMLSFIIAALLLTILPHAVLLSVTGHIYPSSFSASFVPALATIVIILSAAYGKLVGRFGNIYDIFNALSKGIADAAPLFLPILLAVELWHIIIYVIRPL